MDACRSTIINHQPSIRRAFTLVECLISLAISAMLLVAVAVAFNASIINYRENEQMFRTINNARQALTRITSQLRTGHLVDPAAPNTRCSFFTAANEDITYEFRDDSYADPAFRNTLVLITNSNGNEYTLCDNVLAATFTKTLTTEGNDCKSVQISLTVQSGGGQRSLAAAAVVRRNLEM